MDTKAELDETHVIVQCPGIARIRRETGVDQLIREERARGAISDHDVARRILRVERQSRRITIERGIMLGRLRETWMGLVSSL